MKSKDLHLLWGRPDNSRLIPKQISIRLPVHIMAQIRALEIIYPNRTRTEIIGDLLAAALLELEHGLPVLRGKQVGINPEDDKPYFEDVGLRARFRALANKYCAEIETEMGNAMPEKLFDELMIFDSE